MKDKIAFCICTKNRKLKLKKNLSSLLKLKNFKQYNIEIIIVSNDQFDYKQLLYKFSKTFKIKYFKEKLSGVSHSRNKILKILKRKKYKYAAFIDDDCIISKNWLISMITMIKKKRADIITGPQISQSRNIYLKIMERKNTHAKKIKWASTNNVFFKTVAIKNNIKFSVKLNEIGGEDQLYFLKLNKLGKNILWNSQAPVYEMVDKKRENFWWFCKRNLRYGASSIIIYRTAEGFFIGNFIIVLKMLNDLSNSFIFLFKSILLSKINFFRSIMYFLRLIGCFIGITGLQIKEYK